MKYYWFCSLDKDELRAIGANHVYLTSWRQRDGFKLGAHLFWFHGYIFEAGESFDLLMKLKLNLIPIEISEKQYKRLIRGKLVKTSFHLDDRLFGLIADTATKINTG